MGRIPPITKLYSSFQSVVFVLFVFLLPVQLGTFWFPEYSFVDAVRTDYLAWSLYLTDLVTFVLMGAYYRELWSGICKVITFFGIPVMVAGAVLYGLTVLLAIEPAEAVFTTFKLLQFGAVGMVTMVTINRNRMNEWIVGAFLLAAVLQLMLVILQLENGGSLQGFFYFLGERYYTTTSIDAARAVMFESVFVRPYGTFSHPNSLGGFYLLVFVFALFFGAERGVTTGIEAHRRNEQVSARAGKPSGTGKSKEIIGSVGAPVNIIGQFITEVWAGMPGGSLLMILRYLLIIVSMMLVFMSFSKNAIAVLLVVSLFTLMRFIRQGNCRFCGVSRMVIVGVLALTFMASQGDADSVNKRVQLVVDSVSIIKDHPLFGVGPGNYLLAQAELPNRFGVYFLQPVHTIFLLYLAETGLVAGIGMVTLVAWGLWKAVKEGLLPWYAVDASEGMHRQRASYPMYSLILASLFTIAATGMLDHYWVTLQQNILVSAVVIGAGVGVLLRCRG